MFFFFSWSLLNLLRLIVEFSLYDLKISVQLSVTYPLPTFFDYKGKVVTATSEIDGCTEVLTNEGFLRNWPPYNLNECKNWMSAVDKDSVEAFIGKIRRAMQHTGIIFSRFGITGEDSDQRRAAKSLIYSAATEGIITMIFTLKDLERIQEGENFLNLLAEKYKNTVFINA